jgi:gamma-glutamyltranspeptidase/glutathione hydrolase
MGRWLHQRTTQGLPNVMAFGMQLDEAIDAPDFLIPALSGADAF